MKTENHLIKYFARFLVLFAIIGWTACSSDDDKEIVIPLSPDLISDTYLPQSMNVTDGELFSINGRGFQNGDVLIFQSAEKNVEIPLAEIASNYARFIIPTELGSGIQEIAVKRGESIQPIGTTKIHFNMNAVVPDKDGMTIKGIVYAGKTPLEGVRVSDGIVTTVTDTDGFYWLPSDKLHGYVFICIPSGYQPATGTNASPGFWKTLAFDNTQVDSFDFELEKVDNNKHMILVATDTHLANRDAKATDDIKQFRNGFMADAAQFISTQSLPLYTFMLGDLSWDYYWYSNKYDIGNYKNAVSGFKAPMYHIMGNHDNDPYVAGDLLAEAKYKKVLGPSYYSMDIGEVHYVFLDNTVFVNSGGAEGTMGDRSYLKHLTDMQLNWLKEDLAAVTDKSTPVVISFHCPSTTNYNSSFSVSKTFSPASKADEFHNCFTEFSNVHFLSGHTHYNANIQVKPNIKEHNVAAVCETWWWAGSLSGVSVCKDGSPSGYKVFEVDGRDIKWYYKSIGQDKNKQFRTYDSNRVKEYFEWKNVYDVISLIPGRGKDFAKLEANSIILNIWDYDPSWTISVKENGTELTAKRTFMRDPLHVLCYDYTRTKKDGNVNSFYSNENSHMFVVPTGSKDSPLEITVTDGFGNVYKETMIRPKAFGDFVMD